MTCIVGFINSKSKKMTLMADSRSSTPAGFYIDKNEFRDKVFKKGKMVFGCSGTSLLNQVVKYNCEIPELEKGEDTKAYMVTKFIPALRKAVNENNATIKGEKGTMNGTVMIGFNGHIYVIGSNYTITEVADEFTVIGSGSSFAIGSLKTNKSPDQKEKVKFAIKLAAKHINNVGGDIVKVTEKY